MLGTCVKYYTNASLLGDDGTYGWRPNIKGSTTNTYSDVGTPGASGALYFNIVSSAKMALTSGNGADHLSFDALRSNSVYTDSGKVYPLSLALNFIIKA